VHATGLLSNVYDAAQKQINIIRIISPSASFGKSSHQQLKTVRIRQNAAH
jgi:hypothetical protein